MGNAVMADKSLDLLQGTLDVLVLRTLAWGPMHGYAVTIRLLTLHCWKPKPGVSLRLSSAPTAI